jgi:hypothetical protein
VEARSIPLTGIDGGPRYFTERDSDLSTKEVQMQNGDNVVSAGQLLIVEYERIKEEQKARIGFRDNLLYVTLTAMAAVIVAAVPGRQGPAMLLLLPPVSAILGWTYLANDAKISEIGHYIRSELAPRLATMAQTADPVFGWETAHRGVPHRRSRKLMQLTIDLITFFAAPVAALVVFWTEASPSPALVAVSLAETALLLVLAAQILRFADFR